jgi:tetratricopeptide (TPR) repeat protein
MVGCERRDLICLHLDACAWAREQPPVPRSVTAAGICEALEVADSAAGRVRVLDDLDALTDDGLVTTQERAVVDRQSPRTVYFLTDAGRDHAADVREAVRDESVVVTNGITEEVPLAEVDRYMDEEPAPVVTALARLTDDGRVPLEQPVGETFVDRGAEVDTVTRSLEASFVGESRTVAVAGAAGMGKTALVGEAIERVAADRTTLVTARGDCPPGPSRSYGPLRRAFGGLPEGEGLLERLDETSEELTPERPEDVEAQRTALFNDVADEIRDVSTEQPVVVFLDNLQWADAGTLALFEHLATTISKVVYPVSFVGTYRTAEVAAGDRPIREMLDRIETQGAYAEVTLDGLDRENTRSLIEGFLETRQVPGAFVDLVYDRTGGAPLFVEETVQHLRERGAVAPERDEYPTDPGAVSLPAAVTDGIQRRLELLDEPGRELVRLGAVVGEYVPGGVLAAASDLPPADRREYVDLLVASRIWERADEAHGAPVDAPPVSLDATTDGSGDVRFVSGGVRDAVVERLREENTRTCHERVGDAFVEATGDADDVASRVAYHYDRAGADGRAVGYYRRAGDHAAEAYANDDAVSHYRQALSIGRDADLGESAEPAAIACDLAEVHARTGDNASAVATAEEGLALAPAESRVRCRLLGIQAEAQRKQGAYEEARATAERQREIATTLDASELEAAALDHLGVIALRQGTYVEAREQFEQSRSVCQDVGDREGAATSLKNLGRVALNRSEYDGAREYFERSLDISRDVGARGIEAISLNNLGNVAWRQGGYDGAHEHYEQALEIERDRGNRQGQARILHNLGAVALGQGAYDRAREYFERSLETFREVGDREGKAQCLTNLGVATRKQAEYEHASDYLERGLDVAQDLGDRRREVTTLYGLGAVARLEGDYDEGRDYFERSLDLARDLGDRQWEATALHGLGVVSRLEGDHEGAREYHERSLDIKRDLGDRQGVANSLVDLGALAREEGDHDRARDHLDGAMESYEEIGDRDGRAEVRLETGRLSLAEQSLEDARTCAEQAHGTFEELSLSYWRAQSRRLLGRVTAAEGAPAEAHDHLQAALETFEDIGAVGEVLATLRVLVDHHREQGEDERASEWCRRAREVLEDAPDATADRHREWVQHGVADPGD